MHPATESHTVDQLVPMTPLNLLIVGDNENIFLFLRVALEDEGFAVCVRLAQSGTV